MRHRFVTASAVALLFVAAPLVAHAAADPAADGLTTLKIKLALLEKVGADAMEIDVDTVGGVVTLSGDVEEGSTLDRAPAAARSISGVRRVENRLALEADATDDPPARPATDEARGELDDALLETRLRLALVDALGTEGLRVGTEAVGGVVTLEFDRDFPSARRRTAEVAARRLEGVRRVRTVEVD